MTKNKSQPDLEEIPVKFSIDTSSQEAIEKLKSENFLKSLREESKTILKKPTKEK